MRLTFINLLVIFVSVMIMVMVECFPPEEAVKCSAANNRNCSMRNAYGWFSDGLPCVAAEAVFPSSEAQLISAVAAATKLRQKMKPSPLYSHSIPRVSCPGGEAGVVVSTGRMSAVLGVDTSAGTVTAEGGATLRAVAGAAAAAGMAMLHGPYWWGVTVGGMIGTGAHGSSLWGQGSAFHDYVVALTIVSPGGPEDGFVRVRRLVAGRDDRELDAVKVSLGTLGVISQVTLKVEPMFKRSIKYVTKDDSELGDKVLSFGREHEFGDIFWYPSQRKAVYRVDDRVPVNTPGNGLYDFIPFRPTSTTILASVRTLGWTFTGYPVIGFQDRMQSSGTCLDSKPNDPTAACPWDPRTKGEIFHQTTFSIALNSVKPFIQDVQALVALEPRALCGVELYNGILIRYVTASSAYLGKDQDSVDFDMTYYRQARSGGARLHEDILEEIEQIAIMRYGALPHWGKNRNVAFIGAAAKYQNLSMFLKVKDEFDPLGLFSSDWSDQVLGLRNGLEVLNEGCALEGLCICKDDVHCAPKKGYFCRPGHIFKEARVCRSYVKIHF